MSRIQNEDVKTLSELTGAGGAASQLINDTKIYVTANSLNKQLSAAITAGDFAGAPAISTKTANYTLTTSDNIILADATSGTITMTLPTAVGNTRIYTLKRIDTAAANRVIIATTSSQTIDGASSKRLFTVNQSIQVYSDGSNWRVLSSSWPQPIKVRAKNASAMTLTNNAFTTVVCATEDEDNTSSYNNSTGEFTVPTGAAGEYHISVQMSGAATQVPASAARRTSVAVIRVDGSDIAYGPNNDSYQASANASVDGVASITASLTDGQVVTWAVFHNLGANGSPDVGTTTTISITRIGD